MTTPASSPNEPSRFKKILNANNMDESITSRLPRANRVRPTEGGTPIIIAPLAEEKYVTEQRYKFLPAFWTIASILSMVVNVVLIAIVLYLMLNLRAIQGRLNEATGLLESLYGSFAAMDSATISRVVPVDANIPLNLQVPVTLNEQRIVLAHDARIEGVGVQISGGDITVNTRSAVITLPRGTPLIVNLDQFNLPVQNNVPVHLDVPVKIPLNETELHQPFVGLRNIVQPYYCLMKPRAVYSGVQVCP